MVKNGIAQSVHSTRQKRDANLGKSTRMYTGRLNNSLARNQKRMATWCCSYIEGYTTVALRISGHGAAEIFIEFTEERKNLEANPTCSIHKSRSASTVTFEKIKVHRLG